MWGIFTRSGGKPSSLDAAEVLEKLDRLEIAQRRARAAHEELAADLERLQERVSGHLGRSLGGGAGRPRKGAQGAPGAPGGELELGETKDQFRARMQRAGMLNPRIHQALAGAPSPGEADGQE